MQGATWLSGSQPAKHKWPRNQEERLTAWRKVVRLIAGRGFLREADIPKSFAERLTDPILVNPPARVYTLNGVAPLGGGRYRFSTIDFFGKTLHRTRFVVVNDDKFKTWASAYLEASFKAKNPHPDRTTKSAFTHYMHDNNLHWSGCRVREEVPPDSYSLA